MITKNRVFEKLTELNIAFETYYHEALFTCQQAVAVADSIPGAQCKNLFLKDDKKQLYLVVALAETIINLKRMSQLLQAPGLRFANTQLLKEHLGVEPGSVTPFGLIFDTKHKVKVILDACLFDFNQIGFHPLTNTATTVIAANDLKMFLDASGYKYTIINFGIIV